MFLFLKLLLPWQQKAPQATVRMDQNTPFFLCQSSHSNLQPEISIISILIKVKSLKKKKHIETIIQVLSVIQHHFLESHFTPIDTTQKYSGYAVWKEY